MPYRTKRKIGETLTVSCPDTGKLLSIELVGLDCRGEQMSVLLALDGPGFQFHDRKTIDSEHVKSVQIR